MNEPTLMGEGGIFGSRKHRHVTVLKVENGFRCKVLVVRKGKRQPAYGVGEEEDFEMGEEEEYVFYTVEEVLDFVREYLESGKAKLQRE